MKIKVNFELRGKNSVVLAFNSSNEIESVFKSSQTQAKFEIYADDGTVFLNAFSGFAEDRILISDSSSTVILTLTATTSQLFNSQLMGLMAAGGGHNYVFFDKQTKCEFVISWNEGY